MNARTRDRLVVGGGLASLTLVAWGYLLHLAAGMDSQSGEGAMELAPEIASPQLRAWGGEEILALFVMWAVMMVAMMVPSVAPLVMMFARAKRKRGDRHVVGSVWLLLLGYLVAWTGFSAVATAAQWGLHDAALLSPMMVTTSSAVAGLLLIAAGVFQLTPLKHACLAHCRSPLGFLQSNWRSGPRGVFVMGSRHGLYCVGCCWLLMALLFVAGVMNLLYVAAIAAFVLIEKIAPRGVLVGRLTGAILIAGGGTVLALG